MSEENKTKRTIYLSRSERRIGGRRYLRFTALNGFGVSFLGDATVTLLAIHFGAGNLELGIISAMLHISGVALLIVPRLFRGRNVVAVGFWAWMIRGLVGLPYAALLFLEGRAAVALIIGLYAGFCLSRTAGISMVVTVQKRLMVSRTQGDVLFRNATSFQGTTILSRLVSYAVLSLNLVADFSGLLILQLVGIVSNTLAAFQLRRVPNRTRAEFKPGKNLFVILVENLRNRRNRNILILRWISMSQIILFGMVLPFLRRSVGVDPAGVFLYSIAVSLAAFLSSLALRPIAARAGSRPLLFFTAIPTALLFLVWTAIPDKLHLSVYALAGFAAMFFITASGLAAHRLLMDITPDDGAVGFNSMETFVTSIFALVIGFGAGFLADLSLALSSRIPINDFGLVFLPAALGALIQVLLILRVSEPGSLGLAESARILTNVDNLRAWQTISALETTANPVKRKTLVHSVGHSSAPVASSEIGKILSEPLSHEKGELIDALFLTRRPELVGFLCDEALDSHSFHREKAIFALGAYRENRSEAVLRQLLSDPEPRIRAAAAKGLGRIGSETELPAIRSRWKNAEGLRERLDYMIALFHLDPDRRYIADLFSERIVSKGKRGQRTYFTLLANQFGLVPPLGVLYREEAERFGKGLELLLEESRDTPFLLEHGEEIVNLWSDRKYPDVWTLIRDALGKSDPPPVLIPMVRGLLGFSAELGDSANALAGLFFTYQILTAEAGE